MVGGHESDSFNTSEDMFRTVINNRVLLKQINPAINCAINIRYASSKNDNPQNLPHQPVPPLDDTLKKFLKSVKPLLSDKEFQRANELVKDFAKKGGFGQKVQNELMERFKSTSNWFSDWWLEYAYLGFRNPVVVWSSPGQGCPFQNFKNEDDRINYTAKLILAAVSYKMLIDANKIPMEMMGKNQLDMMQYKKIFGTCRIPSLPVDGLELNPKSEHIVVVHNNHFYKVQTMYNGKPPSENQLKQQLRKIIDKTVKRARPVGIYTADERDAYAKNYQELIKDPKNKESANVIQKCLFLVCLDGAMPDYGSDNRETAGGRQFIHGGGSKFNTGNRWYDKTIQFVIGRDGLVGLTYEHSPSEGGPVAVMVDYVAQFIKKDSGKSIPDVLCKEPVELPFKLNDKLNEELDKASKRLDKLVADLDLNTFIYTDFGKEFIKSQKLSPDSFIQIAMQYAFYRSYGKPAAHYESASSRKFVHGRTETIRSCSEESVAFAKAMLSQDTTNENKVKALKAAINEHKNYTLQAVNGLGVDRHLLGLKLMAQKKGIPLHDLYKDVSFTRSSHFRISSSQVATKCAGYMCYGPVVTDGYGVCYNPRNEDIYVSVGSMHSCSDTSSTKFRHALAKSFSDMREVLLKTSSKL